MTEQLRMNGKSKSDMVSLWNDSRHFFAGAAAFENQARDVDIADLRLAGRANLIEGAEEARGLLKVAFSVVGQYLKARAYGRAT
ncbi:hypothetical protein ACKWRH_46800 (plasmid) [Bradyrhizobium sp. Pa8]|uniref:hypothetical protein n=1 Tax=Bradyrhizobium sp. Pa8 TaxID=3386552 RepID=UPI00403F1D1F